MVSGGGSYVKTFQSLRVHMLSLSNHLSILIIIVDAFFLLLLTYDYNNATYKLIMF